MIKIVFLDYKTFPENAKLKRPKFPHQYEEYDYTLSEEVVPRCKEADVIITNKVNIDKAAIDQLPKLKLIALTATGMNNIDLKACQERNIRVSNVVNYGTASVAEHTLMLIMNLYKQFVPYYQDMVNKAWCQSPTFCYFKETVKELSHSKIGIIGAGVLGREVGRLSSAFGMEVVYVGRKSSTPKPDLTMCSLEEALKTCDVISIHCPLTPETRNLITLKEIKMMKKTSFIVNTARGGIVNEADLKVALEGGIIAGAGFDVLEEEPPGNENILANLTHLPNFILTPHIAWIGNRSIQNLLDMTLANIENFFQENN